MGVGRSMGAGVSVGTGVGVGRASAWGVFWVGVLVGVGVGAVRDPPQAARKKRQAHRTPRRGKTVRYIQLHFLFSTNCLVRRRVRVERDSPLVYHNLCRPPAKIEMTRSFYQIADLAVLGEWQRVPSARTCGAWGAPSQISDSSAMHSAEAHSTLAASCLCGRMHRTADHRSVWGRWFLPVATKPRPACSREHTITLPPFWVPILAYGSTRPSFDRSDPATCQT